MRRLLAESPFPLPELQPARPAPARRVPRTSFPTVGPTRLPLPRLEQQRQALPPPNRIPLFPTSQPTPRIPPASNDPPSPQKACTYFTARIFPQQPTVVIALAPECSAISTLQNCIQPRATPRSGVPCS